MLKKIILVIIILILVGFGGFFAYEKVFAPKSPVQITDITYKNDQYGFELTFPDSWKGYSVAISSWNGQLIDTSDVIYSGPSILIKNPQTTAQQAYQDIPIMVFTPDVWKLVSEEKVAVSAAPIGPAKIGENAKYVFATPPRWYGFTDAIGYQEAVEIVKTFKAFEIK